MQKVTYLSPQNFSKRFAGLFKNEEYSDCEIILKKSKKVIPGHKIILCSSSDFFEKHFEKSEKYDLPENEDEERFLKFLQFLYTGAYDYGKEEDVIDFIKKTTYYGVKQISEFKIPSRKLLKVIIKYIEDDEKRMKDFDLVLRHVDFSVFEKDELLLIFKRVPWITDSLHFLKSILQKDVTELYGKNEDSEDELEEKIEFENIFKNEDEQTDSTKECMKWDKNHKGSYINLEKSGKIAVFNGSSWQGSVLGVKGSKFTLKVVTNSTNAMIGFSTRSFNANGSNYSTCGYFMYFSGLTLYSGSGNVRKSGHAYGNLSGGYRNVNVGDYVGAVYDKRKKTITFYLNGKSLGVAYNDVNEKELYPCLDFYTMSSKVEFVKGKYKK